MKTKQYDLVKVITTFLVVMAHITRMYTGQGVIKPLRDAEILSIFTTIIYSFHMPLFICVSGMVYGMCVDDLGKYSNGFTFLISKAKRLLIPYYFFGIFVVAPIMTAYDFADNSYISYVIKGIGFVTNSRHLWFIFTLFLIFAVSACIKNILQKMNEMICFACLLFMSFMSQYVFSVFQLNMLMYYMFFFYMGYVINKNYEKVSERCKNPVILLVSAVIVITFCNSETWMVKVMVAIAGIFFTIGSIQYINIEWTNCKIYENLKKNTFGVYLFHPMIIYVLFYYFGDLDIEPIMLVSIIFVVTYVVSHFATNLVRKIKWGIVIGE